MVLVVVAALGLLTGVLTATGARATAQAGPPPPSGFSESQYRTVAPAQRPFTAQAPSTATAPPQPQFRTPNPSAVANAKARAATSGPQPEVATPGPEQAGSTLEAIVAFATTNLNQQIGWFGSQQDVQPPDTQLAAGPTDLLETINSSLSVWSKAGGLIDKESFYNFFDVPAGSFFTDPRVVYDAASGRFFVSGFSIAGPSSAPTGSQAYLAVSTTSDPTGTWTFYTIESNNSGIVYDQPKLGVNDDKIVLSWDDYSGAGDAGSSWTGSETWVVDKGEALKGMAVSVVSFTSTTQFGLVPAVSLSSTCQNNICTEYLVVNDASTDLPGLTSPPSAGLLAINGTPSAFDVTMTLAPVPVAMTSAPPSADQPGEPGSVATNDDRFLSATWQDGELWVSGNVGCTPIGASTVQPCMGLTEIGTAGPSLTQQITLGEAAAALYFPAVTTDTAGDLFVSYTLSSSSTYPTAELSALPTGAASFQSLTVQPGQGLYLPTSCGFGAPRWGDYSGAAVDPLNPSDVWLTAEFAASSSNNCNWGTATAEATLARPAYTVGAEGLNGALWVQSPGLPSGWQSLGGGIIASPAVAAVPQPSGLASPLFVATGTDHSLWIRSLGQSWTDLTPGLFTYCLNNPAAVVTGSTPMLTVACEGSDHSLNVATVPVPVSGLPSVSSWTNLGGALGAGPSVAPVNGVLTYFVTASFNGGQVWTRTNGTDWGPTSWYCVGHPASGIAVGGSTTWFGCQGLDGELWAGPVSNGVTAQGGDIEPGVALGITSAADFMFGEASFGANSVWFRTTTADWADLGGSVVNGVGAVGLN